MRLSRSIRWTHWAVRVCVLVLVLAGFAQLVHFHAPGSSKTQNCATCVANHNSVIVAGVFYVTPERLVAGSVVAAPSSGVASGSDFYKPIRSPPPTPEIG